LKTRELLVVGNDKELIEAMDRLKRGPGRNIAVPGGVRTAQTFSRLGLIDEYVLMVHPVAIGEGKRLFTQRTDLPLVSSKTYDSGVMQVRYRPRTGRERKE
jgi:dihydrofolate reductase